MTVKVRILICSLVLTAVQIFCVPAVHGGAQGTEAGQISRPDAQAVKQYTREILSDPRFAPRKSFWQWLSEKLSGFDGPDWDLGPGFARSIMILIVIWCVLTLIAIGAHFVWTLVVLSRKGRMEIRTGKRIRLDPLRAMSFEELLARSREQAQEGNFHEAASVLLTALLKYLGARQVVLLHESKTNGDYLREYPTEQGGREDFRVFLLMFERSIYGGLGLGGQTYEKMNEIMERVCRDVRPNA